MTDYTSLKRLAEHHINLHGDTWHAEESKALESLPTFSSEWFVATASPAVVLALIAENERLKSNVESLREGCHSLNGALTNTEFARVETLAELRKSQAKNKKLKAEVEALRKHAPSAEIVWCACGDGYPANSYGSGFMDANNGVCENCDAANGGVEPDLEALRKDAERYRWMRNKARSADWEHIGFQTPESIDYEIDAAMSKEAGHD